MRRRKFLSLLGAAAVAALGWRFWRKRKMSFYFVESIGNGSVGRIRKVDAGTLSTLAGFTDGDGPSGLFTSHSGFGSLWGIVQDAAGNLYVLDVDWGIVYKVTPALVVTAVVGNGQQFYGGDNGPATAAGFEWASALAIDAAGNLYILDSGSASSPTQNCVRAVNMQGTTQTILGVSIPAGYIKTVVGLQGQSPSYYGNYAGDGGAATSAEISAGSTDSSGLAMDAAGNLYIADTNNSCIRKVATGGTITTVAGTPLSSGYGGDGGAATSAVFQTPTGVTTDGSVLFVADYLNARVRAVNLSGGTLNICGISIAAGNIDTVCGTGAHWTSPIGWGSGTGVLPGEGSQAITVDIEFPAGVLMNSTDVYIGWRGDTLNWNCIRNVDSSGVLTTFAGTGHFGESNGAATSSLVNNVNAMRFAAAGPVEEPQIFITT